MDWFEVLRIIYIRVKQLMCKLQPDSSQIIYLVMAFSLLRLLALFYFAKVKKNPIFLLNKCCNLRLPTQVLMMGGGKTLRLWVHMDK